MATAGTNALPRGCHHRSRCHSLQPYLANRQPPAFPDARAVHASTAGVRSFSPPSVVCRLEDADYEGHSLAMLRRIAEVLGKRIEIRFVPADKPSVAVHGRLRGGASPKRADGRE